MTCSCNLAGMLSMNYAGITSASLNGGTEVTISDDGTVLIGATINNLSITAWAYVPGSDRFLGATCNASANAEIRWMTKYDCVNDVTHFVPLSGGKASIVGGPINGISLSCDPGIVSKSFNASVGQGPTTPYSTENRRDGFNLIYSGTPIQVESGSPRSYGINLGPVSVTAYLQSFSLTINPPSPATVNYSFVIPGAVI
jgi:hypothetical protein